MVRTFSALPIGPLTPSHQCVHGIGSVSRNFVSVSCFSSRLTLTSTNGLPSSFLTSARSCGIIALHGPHQVAHTSTTTTLPRRSLSLTGLPSRSLLAGRLAVAAAGGQEGQGLEAVVAAPPGQGLEAGQELLHQPVLLLAEELGPPLLRGGQHLGPDRLALLQERLDERLVRLVVGLRLVL